jgi:hypothetical protein
MAILHKLTVWESWSAVGQAFSWLAELSFTVQKVDVSKLV